MSNKLSQLPTIASPAATDSLVGIQSPGSSPQDGQMEIASIFPNLQGNYPTKRNNNGANITETAGHLKTGWICGQPGVNATITFTITFDAAFANVPIVLGVFGGDTAAVTSTLGSGGPNLKQAFAEATDITTTGFVLICCSRDGTSWAANNTVYAQWFAMGA